MSIPTIMLAIALLVPAPLPSSPPPPSVPEKPADTADPSAAAHLIPPDAGEEPWRNLKWENDLWTARTAAAAAGKPVFLWNMDGHPQGGV